MDSMEQLRAYLDHIGVSYREGTKPSLGLLQRVQLAHLQRLPFANVAVQRAVALPFERELPRLDPDSLAEKLLGRQWGGYCFEHNLLLLHALRGLGFTSYAVAGRVIKSRPTEGTQIELAGWSHLLLFVKVPEEGAWRTVDVGFGGEAMLVPLRLTGEEERAPASGTAFRLRRGVEGSTEPPGPEQEALGWRSEQQLGWYAQRQRPGQAWHDLYFFTDVEATPHSIEAMNEKTFGDEAGRMNATLIASLAQADGGRKTLLDRSLRIISPQGHIDEIEFKTDAAVAAALSEHFGIRPEDESAVAVKEEQP